MSKNKNMELWNRICKTDPAYTKKVKKSAKSREFTAISAQYQVMRATEVWGPCGGAWGFSWEWMPHETLWIATVALYYPAGEMTCRVSQMGTARRDGKYGIDDDAMKKAITDGLTKCLSYTGMSADVFLGLYDDNKYVSAMWEEFGQGGGSNGANPEPANLAKAKADFSAVVERLRKDVKSTLTNNAFIHSVIADFSHGPVLTTIGAVTAVRKAVEDGRYDLVTGKRAEKDPPTDGKPRPAAPEPEPGRDFMTEISGLAKVRYGADWFDYLNAECKEHGINLGKMNDEEAVKIIGLLSGQLEGGQ